MSDDEKFLSRWSQRKREAARTDAPSEKIELEVPEGSEPDESDNASDPPMRSEEAIDLSTLPKLEDITGDSDITGFLKKGVPDSLRNAALRKSWALDPAIRNYVNPALEYAYDWNTPGGVPGTSELSAGTDIARMVTQIMGVSDSPADAESAEATDGPKPPPPDVARPPEAALQTSEMELPVEAVRISQETETAGDISVETPVETPSSISTAPQHPVRRHGSAKPRV